MLQGSLKDVSLPGLMQFLANEDNKSYRLTIEKGAVPGEILISSGQLVSASYGLLRGEDALSEFLTWDEGDFTVERLPPPLETTIAKNIDIRLKQSVAFADQASFLLADNIGLNTVIRPSRMFGTPAWQESSKLQPLAREDFLILGWLSTGRTMRQAMREFAFDLVQSVAILYRLVLTRSVEVVRTTVSKEIAAHTARHIERKPETSPVVSNVDDSPNKHHQGPPKATSPEMLATTPEANPAADASCRRTTVLPIISIDIERLMKATFSITEFGFLALKNPSLDEGIRQILLSVEKGKTLEAVIAEASRQPQAMLSTYRYCLERGYITNPDSVLSLTADLLLGRTELDQYLLQRRRVTGEQLRELVQAARTQGVKLSQALVEHGFLCSEDLETIMDKRQRFAKT
ncbi:MAG: DUF4388 domain-containing protein [Candidatus Melainabacteria bacterium]|nr:DUF4388 domain-containing protein [Candidatus Melainabacteria bacterium]